MRSAYRFEGGIRKAIHALKYEGRQGIAKPLAGAVALVLTPDSRQGVLCAVPLHVKRQAERGYNQSDLLAQELALYWGIPYLGEGALQRIRETPPQVGLDFAARQANMRQAFVAQPDRVKGQSVILVDDVCTTGATLDACAQALLTAGAVSVSAVTVARALKLEPSDR
jgi:ComF family protein